MIRLFRREWGAVTFVATVLIGRSWSGSRSWSAAGGHTTPWPTSASLPLLHALADPVAGAASTSTPFAFGNCRRRPPSRLRAPADAHPEPDRDAEPVRLGFRVRLGLGFRVGVSLASAKASASPTATPASG